MPLYGPKFPLSKGNQDAFELYEDIEQQIGFFLKNLILTSPGEKISDPRYGEEYYYYEFNANGTMAVDFVNTWLVFGAGNLEPKGNRQLDVSFENPSLEALKSALIFRKVGSTTLVTDSEQINRVIKGDTYK